MPKRERADRRRRSVVLFLIALATAACSDGQYQPPKPAPTPQELYALAATASGVAVGKATAGGPVYIFFDPQCPSCAALWTNVKPLHGEAKLVWIPVGLLGPASSAQGAAILSADDPIAAMDEHETSILNRGGGITALGAATEAMTKVANNTALFRETANRGVPLIVYRNQRTGSYGTQTGSRTADEFSALLGR